MCRTPQAPGPPETVISEGPDGYAVGREAAATAPRRWIETPLGIALAPAIPSGEARGLTTSS